MPQLALGGALLVLLVLLLVLLLVSLLFRRRFVAGFAASFAAGFTAGLAAGLAAGHEHCDSAEPSPLLRSRAATLKQIPVPLTPRQIPRAALTFCLVHPRPVKFFLGQLDERSLLPTTATLAGRRRRDNVPMMPLSLCSALYMKPNMSLGLCQASSVVGPQYISLTTRVLLFTAATPLLFTSCSHLLLLLLMLLLLLLTHFVSKSSSATISGQGTRLPCFSFHACRASRHLAYLSSISQASWPSTS